MRRSNFEMNIAILKALSDNGVLKATHIMYKSNLNAVILKEKLSALEANGLIQVQCVCRQRGSGVFYSITAKGLAVVRSFLSVKDVLEC
jgi:predicted transcriptional regulator